MEVRRVPYQTDETLWEFYGSRAGDPASQSAEIGQRMLALLDGLAATNGPPLWGMTSHLAMHLFTDSGSLGGACVHGHGPGYVVEFDRGGEPVSAWAADPAGAIELIRAALDLPVSPPLGSHPNADPGAAIDRGPCHDLG